MNKKEKQREFERGLRAAFLYASYWVEIKAERHDRRQPGMRKELRKFAKELRQVSHDFGE